jgi:RNA polymerase sigma-70 factor (ECF subfamily)
VEHAGPRRFSTTRWSLVLAAGNASAEGAHEALAELCRLYWYPVYAFVRRRGHAPEDSLDLTQEFFTRLIEQDSVKTADPARGKFRSWLLGALKHFLANEWDRTTAQKRDHRRVVSLDGEEAENRYLREPDSSTDPERLFHRRWALSLLERVMTRLRDECRNEEKAELFEKVKGLLIGPEAEEPAYQPIARELGIRPETLRVTVFRLRKRYGALLRQEIAETVDRSDAVEEEIEFLLGALSAPGS